jgi:hypothetical protein
MYVALMSNRDSMQRVSSFAKGREDGPRRADWGGGRGGSGVIDWVG